MNGGVSNRQINVLLDRPLMLLHGTAIAGRSPKVDPDPDSDSDPDPDPDPESAQRIFAGHPLERGPGTRIPSGGRSAGRRGWRGH